MSEKSALSRRSFLGLGATAALAAGAAGLAGCAPSSPGAADASAGNGSADQPEAIGFGGGQGPTSMGYGRIQNPSFLTPPAPLAESDAAEVQEADVVILGAGNAGCAAAASACATRSSRRPTANPSVKTSWWTSPRPSTCGCAAAAAA